MSIITTSPPWARGIPAVTLGRNGSLTDSYDMTTLSQFVNMLSSRRMHVLAQGGNSVGNYAPSGVIIAGSFHTSANCSRVEAIVIAGRSTSATDFGQSFWTINATAQPTMYVGGSVSGTTGPNDLTTMRQTMTESGAQLTPDTTYTWTLSVGSVPVSVLYYVIYEVPKTTVDTDTDLALPHDPFQVGAPILDRDMADVSDTLWTLYSRSGLPHFAFSHISGSIPSATSTYKNILDGSTGGYGANEAGYRVIPYRKNRLTKSTLDVVLWCVSGVSGGGSDGSVRFTNQDGVMGTISGISTATVYTVVATIDATVAGSQLVTVEHKSTAHTISTISAGMYELI